MNVSSIYKKGQKSYILLYISSKQENVDIIYIQIENFLFKLNVLKLKHSKNKKVNINLCDEW